MSTIKDQLRTFLATSFFLDPARPALKDSDSFLEQQILDSTGFLELITYVEETFAIRVADTEMLPENLDSLEAVEAYVKRKQMLTATAPGRLSP
jgi:acyl carrier protein